MTIPDTRTFVECTQEQWSDYLSDLRTYQTESIFGAYSIMYSRLSDGAGYAQTGKAVAEVHYLPNNQRVYFIPAPAKGTPA